MVYLDTYSVIKIWWSWLNIAEATKQDKLTLQYHNLSLNVTKVLLLSTTNHEQDSGVNIQCFVQPPSTSSHNL